MSSFAALSISMTNCSPARERFFAALRTTCKIGYAMEKMVFITKRRLSLKGNTRMFGAYFWDHFYLDLLAFSHVSFLGNHVVLPARPMKEIQWKWLNPLPATG